MDKLNIDLKSISPYVIDAFSSVYGDEHRSIISKKINNACRVVYYDVEGLKDYVLYLKRCKAREFSIRFLDEIGIDVQAHKKSNYTEPLDSGIQKILDSLIGADFGFSKDADYLVPLRSFDSNNKTYSNRILLKNRIKIVNYLLGNEREQITEENFEAFTKTKEFSELLRKINEFNIVYEKLLSEYNDWAEQLVPYEKYVEDEEKRKEDILQENKNELFRYIFEQLPSSVKDSISNKSFEEQQEIVLGSLDISVKSIIEYFHCEQIEKLKSPDVALNDKFRIVYWQSMYLKKLGILISNENMLDYNSEEDVTNYLSFLSQDDIRKYIPSDEVISFISSTRENYYEKALQEYYTTRKDFIDAMKMFYYNSSNLELVYNQIKNKNLCIMGLCIMEGNYKKNNEFISLMFYTIKKCNGGNLFFNYMLGNGCIIDHSLKGMGFETTASFFKGYRKNPYDKVSHIYEKFNRALNDIFSREAVKYLQDQGIYLLEPEEFTSLDTSNNNNNTASITNNLLQPLLQKFREQVIKAKIYSEPKRLTRYIGKDNFEELVDAVNKVVYLLESGVVSKIDTSPEDAMVMEYFEQIERVKQIYINIDNFFANKFGYFPKSEFEKVKGYKKNKKH